MTTDTCATCNAPLPVSHFYRLGKRYCSKRCARWLNDAQVARFIELAKGPDTLYPKTWEEEEE